MSATVAAVVVTYNRKELLLENIESLLAQTKKDVLDVVIVDNASTDGTAEALAPYIEAGSIIYQNTGSNLGGAGGFQYGIRYAAERHYEFIWVMDDDCMPTPDALEQLLLCHDKLEGKYGYLSSKVLWKDGNICQMNVQRRTLTKNVEDFESELVPITMASFVSMFMQVSTVREVGLPIKEFFIWTDDWEYTRRISKKYPCYLANGSVVVHKSAVNIGANIEVDDEARLDRYRLRYRNDLYLYRQEGFKGFVYGTCRLGLHTMRVLLKAKSKRWKRIKMVWGGTKDGLKFKPAVEYVKTEEETI